MKIKTQVIDKIEDVQYGDVVICSRHRDVVSDVMNGRVYGIVGNCAFEQCTVVRISVEGE